MLQQDLPSSSSCDAEEADMIACLKEFFKVVISQTICLGIPTILWSDVSHYILNVISPK